MHHKVEGKGHGGGILTAPSQEISKDFGTKFGLQLDIQDQAKCTTVINMQKNISQCLQACCDLKEPKTLQTTELLSCFKEHEKVLELSASQ